MLPIHSGCGLPKYLHSHVPADTRILHDRVARNPQVLERIAVNFGFLTQFRQPFVTGPVEFGGIAENPLIY